MHQRDEFSSDKIKTAAKMGLLNELFDESLFMLKLCDFGLSIELNENDEMKPVNMMVPLRWSAPEILINSIIFIIKFYIKKI
jgi:hypothetical protein